MDNPKKRIVIRCTCKQVLSILKGKYIVHNPGCNVALYELDKRWPVPFEYVE